MLKFSCSIHLYIFEYRTSCFYCLGMIRVCPSIPKSYIKEELKLVNKYRPIEIDPYMPREEKIKHMIDWWKGSEELLKYFNYQ